GPYPHCPLPRPQVVGGIRFHPPTVPDELLTGGRLREVDYDFRTHPGQMPGARLPAPSPTIFGLGSAFPCLTLSLALRARSDPDDVRRTRQRRAIRPLGSRTGAYDVSSSRRSESVYSPSGAASASGCS